MTRVRELLTRWRRQIGLAFVIVVVVILTVWQPWQSATPEPVDKSLSEVQQLIASHEAQRATVYEVQRRIVVVTATGSFTAEYPYEYADELIDKLSASGVAFDVDESTGESWLEAVWSAVGWLTAPIVIVGGLYLLTRSMNSGSLLGNKQDFSTERPAARFSDVLGAKEAVDKMRRLVKYLDKPKDFAGIGVPRGYLFIGPTGVGKTLLAEATAGEANCSFYMLSGASLQSRFSGGSSEQVGQFFARIKKKHKPDERIVIFMDEIDGIASKRTGDMMSDRDRNTTVTKLLFDFSEFFKYFPYGVLIGATNHKDAVDEAIIRPGRLGVHLTIPNPDVDGRSAILSKNEPAMPARGIELRDIALLCAGMSGAQAAAIPVEAALLARERGSDVIEREDYEEAAMAMVMGELNRSRQVSPDDRRLAAVHESGHATVAHASPYRNLLVVTVIPIGPSGGSTWATTDERLGYTEDWLMWEMAFCMAAREAELEHRGCVSSGPAHDIQQATALALHAICEWGLFDEFLTRVDIQNWQNSPNADKIQAKVDELIEHACLMARGVLDEHSGFQNRLLEALSGDVHILHSQQLAEIAAA